MTEINRSPGTETAAVPALGAGGSGIIGWLSQAVDWLSQVFTAIGAMSAKLPASLGTKTAAGSLSVAPASDAVFPVGATATPSATLTRPADTTAYAAGGRTSRPSQRTGPTGPNHESPRRCAHPPKDARGCCCCFPLCC